MPIPRSGTAGLGVVLYLAGVAMFAVNDALGKWLVTDYGVGQLMLLRTIGAAVVLAPMLAFAPRQADRFPATRASGLARPVRSCGHFRFLLRDAHHAARRRHDLLYGDAAHHHGVIGAAARRKGRALSLDRRPDRLCWGPHCAQTFAADAVLGRADRAHGAIAYALSQTITRDLRGIHWAPLVLWQFVGSGLLGAATIPWSWTTPSLFDLGLMFLVGVVAMICIICVVRALGFARVAVLAPLQYTGLLWAAILGWLIWRDVPTLPIVIGNAIIIGSGLYVAARGKMVGKAAE